MKIKLELEYSSMKITIETRGKRSLHAIDIGAAVLRTTRELEFNEPKVKWATEIEEGEDLEEIG